MSTKKSLFSKAGAILFSLIILVGGASKLYRGINDLGGSKGDPKVGELLEKSDATVTEANRLLTEIMPSFQELLGDFDTLGHAAFRTEKRESSAKVTDQLVSISKHFRSATQTVTEAIEYEKDKKIVDFMKSLAISYESMAKVSEKNVEIIGVTLDESLTDSNEIIQKVTAIAESRDVFQKEANDATAEANAIIKQ